MKRFHALGFCLVLTYCAGLTGAQPGGFISIDCGATTSYTDNGTGIVWVPDAAYTNGGSVATLSSNVSGGSVPLQTLRYFPGAQGKYCFNVGPVNQTSRYLVRATFLYGNYDNASVFPTFSISVGASPWASVKIANATFPYFNEFVAVATNSTSFVVCLMSGSTGSPFISTLELRPLTGAMYSLSYMGSDFLNYVTRINFGAPNADPVRYPDDPVDRIWVSDQVADLQDEAPLTYPISTSETVVVTAVNDVPPMKVMQTANVGGEGQITYRLNLPTYFPASCYAVLYFAEIQTLQSGDVREFNFSSNINDTLFSGLPLDLARDVTSFKAFEPGFPNVTLPAFLYFSLTKTNDSTLDPLVSAMEIYQILPVIAETYSGDVEALKAFTSQLQGEESAGDPCLPVSWNFVMCSSDSPPRVTEINLSGRNLSGSIPASIGDMTSLANLWLDNNNLTGSIPDLSQLTALQSLRLQSNQLSGPFPVSLEDLSNLTELFVADNNLTGTVPLSLQDKSDLRILANGNPYLCSNVTCAGGSKSSVSTAVVVGVSVGGAVAFLLILLSALIALLLWRRHKNRKKIKRDDPLEGSKFPFQINSSSTDFGFVNEEEIPPDGARLVHLPELVAATDNFARMIGSGGFGPVYYGKAKDGQEIAVKVLSAGSSQGAREFFNEVNLLSRVHHRNLVPLLGYCPDIKEKMLIYEFMHKGSLRDHLHGPIAEDEPLDWLARLNILLDAAKGLEYLHTGCHPSIIHRDVKSSNILINSKSVGKVADFGLSKLTSEEFSAVSTAVRGTVGYLDPEYYVSMQLTTKSDIFSFGVVLLEAISGREPIIAAPRGSAADTTIVNWARSLLQKGDVQSMVDPAMDSNYRVESLWKLAELALRSVEPYGRYRPTIKEVVLELTEIIDIETVDSVAAAESDNESFGGFSLAKTRTHSPSSSINPLHSGSLDGSYNEPILR